MSLRHYDKEPTRKERKKKQQRVVGAEERCKLDPSLKAPPGFKV